MLTFVTLLFFVVQSFVSVFNLMSNSLKLSSFLHSFLYQNKTVLLSIYDWLSKHYYFLFPPPRILMILNNLNVYQNRDCGLDMKHANILKLRCIEKGSASLL